MSEQVDPRVVQAIRDIHDAEYEDSTSWPRPPIRTNLARRHRFDEINREADEREQRRRDDIETERKLALAAAGVIALAVCMLALLAWLLATA